MEFVKSFVREEEGQDVLEYGLLMAFVAVIAVASINLVGGNIGTIWTSVETGVASAVAALP